MGHADAGKPIVRVEIDTLWNVKLFYGAGKGRSGGGRNRYIVECKDEDDIEAVRRCV